MASKRSIQQDYGYSRTIRNESQVLNHSPLYKEASRSGVDASYYQSSAPYTSSLVGTASYNTPISASQTSIIRSEPHYISNGGMSNGYGSAYGSYTGQFSPLWESGGGAGSQDEYGDDDYALSASMSDHAFEIASLAGPAGDSRSSGKTSRSSSSAGGKSHSLGKSHSQRRPSNRDEFDGPHQFLQRPPPEYIAQQERDLPHLPTNLVVQEQDSVLTRVNERLSQCAFDFVARYQFPIPVTGEMRRVEGPRDREWTEWVYLLKRLATKRRIPARVLYNGQIKQLVTILENSLEMRHAAKHQSRPLKDDRNILQLISAGIQVAKILKDASAMDYLDRLYVTTERQIQERRESVRYR